MGPYLVVMSGYPGAGKTTITQYLKNKYDFSRFSLDDMRQSFFKYDSYESYIEDSRFSEKESALFEIVHEGKIVHLKMNFNVVIDFTAAREEMRERMFNLKSNINKDFQAYAQKYLIWVDVERDILIKRNLELQRDPIKLMETWDKHWVVPRENSKNYQLIKYANNSPEDLEKIMHDLDKRFNIY